MKFIIGCVLALCASTSWAVIADGDERDHSTINEIEKAMGDGNNVKEINRKDLNEIAKNMGVVVKPGYVIVGIGELNDKNQVIGVVLCIDQGKNVPTTAAVNDHYIVAVYQEDQTKPLAEVNDIFVFPDQDDSAQH